MRQYSSTLLCSYLNYVLINGPHESRRRLAPIDARMRLRISKSRRRADGRLGMTFVFWGLSIVKHLKHVLVTLDYLLIIGIYYETDTIFLL